MFIVLKYLELSPMNDNLELSPMSNNLELSPLQKFIFKLKDFSKDLTQVKNRKFTIYGEKP